MSEQPTPPSGSPESGKDKPKRSRSPVPKTLLKAINDATETVGTAGKEPYAVALAKAGIDASFITELGGRIEAANKLVSGSVGASSDKSTTTDAEDLAKEALAASIEDVQAMAKCKYTKPGDPQRRKYYIGQPIERSRPQLVGAANSILETLAKEPLAGVTPEMTAALKTALETYKTVQTEQAGDQAQAGGVRKELDAEVAAVKALRKKILYTVDALWPARKPANAPIRKEFKLPPNRPLS